MSEIATDKLWVFGYGSLCWNPGFKYSDAQLGCVKGFKRRFWQGNNSHRGTETKLGRVVTLIEDENELTWGKAFQLDDESVSRSYLDNREVQLGGYTTILTTFEPLDTNVEPFPVLIYIALENNDQYLGKASYDQMAMDIISSKGAAGHNLEYLAKLAQFMRENLPHIEDDHLYLLEQFCIFILKSLNSSLLNYFYTHSIEDRWLNRIQHELSKQQHRLRQAHTHRDASTFDLSDGEEADSGESSPCLCCSDDELTSSDDLLFNTPSDYNSTHLINGNGYLINQLLNSSPLLLNADLLNSDRLYLNNKKLQLNHADGLQSNDPYQANPYLTNHHLQSHSLHKAKKISFSDFNHQNRHPSKWYIKGY